MSDFTIYNNIPRVLTPPPEVRSASLEKPDSFLGALKEAVAQVNQLDRTSEGELKKFVNDESDLHSVMLALEKADLSFQMMMQVRNKIVAAYQEIMKTQV